MSMEASRFKLGLFTIVGAALLVAGVVALGAGALLQEALIVETYLDESVQGLDVGAPVKYRGVHVGNVKEIGFVRHEYPTESVYVMLRLAIHPRRLGSKGRDIVLDPAKMNEEVSHGLRLRLASQGLTGAAYIEADYVDASRTPELKFDWTPAHSYIPSAPSTATRLMESLERTLRKLEQMEVDRLSADVVTLVGKITKLVEGDLAVTVRSLGTAAKEVPGAVAELKVTLAEKVAKPLQEMLTTVNKVVEQDLARTLKSVDSAAKEMPEAVAQIRDVSAGAQKALRRVDRLVASQEDDLQEVLENFRVVSQDLRELGAAAKRYPSGLLFGEKPPKTQMEKK